MQIFCWISSLEEWNICWGWGAFPVRLEREKDILCYLYFGDRREISLIIKEEFHFDPCSLEFHIEPGRISL